MIADLSHLGTTAKPSVWRGALTRILDQAKTGSTALHRWLDHKREEFRLITQASGGLRAGMPPDNEAAMVGIDGAETLSTPTGDRRRARRHATVLLVGHVRHRGASSVCLVHDISSDGLMARFTQVPTVGDQVEVSVRGLAPAQATVRWVKGYRAGLAFVLHQDLSGVLGRYVGMVPRAPRFEVALATELCAGGERAVVELVDISPGGAKLIVDRLLPPGTPVQLWLPGEAEAKPATICWSREPFVGLRFTYPVDMGTVARLIARGDGRTLDGADVLG